MHVWSHGTCGTQQVSARCLHVAGGGGELGGGIISQDNVIIVRCPALHVTGRQCRPICPSLSVAAVCVVVMCQHYASVYTVGLCMHCT